MRSWRRTDIEQLDAVARDVEACGLRKGWDASGSERYRHVPAPRVAGVGYPSGCIRLPGGGDADITMYSDACLPAGQAVARSSWPLTRRAAYAGFSQGVSAPVHSTPNSARRCCASGLASMMMVWRRRVPDCTAILSP